MAMWNPWRGCHKYSEGCRHCYINYKIKKRFRHTNRVLETLLS